LKSRRTRPLGKYEKREEGEDKVRKESISEIIAKGGLPDYFGRGRRGIHEKGGYVKWKDKATCSG